MEKGIRQYLQQGASLTPTAQKQLAMLVRRYPYFQAARLLWMRSLYQQHDENFGVELRNSALSLPSRAALYGLVEGDRLKQQILRAPSQKKQNENDSDRTSLLIGSFLDSLPEERKASSGRVRLADARVDYMEYLMQTDPNNPILGSASTATTHGDELIENFLDNNSKIEIKERAEEELQKPQLNDESSTENDIFTETLASIYIKQGKYENALEIIRRLYLKNPKKNRYFADQVRFLEKLLVNNKNKNK